LIKVLSRCSPSRRWTTSTTIVLLFISFTVNSLIAENKFGAYYTRLPFDDNHTGKFADIVVRLDAIGGEIIFGRQSSYLPLWKNDHGEWHFDQIVPRKGDGKGMMPDVLNKYAYARVIENTSNRVIVHYRYMPDFTNVAPDGVVHEYFTILPSGSVIRTIKEGSERFDDFNDPQNVTVQNLNLRKDGIKQTDITLAKLQKRDGGIVNGNPIKDTRKKHPVAWWKFDEGLSNRNYEDEFKTIESISSHMCNIAGGKAFWKAGVSGTCLAFDGYHSKVTLPVSNAPVLDSGLTLDLWVAIGAYPFNTTAIVQQFNHIDAGYYLGLTAYGNPVFKLAIKSKLFEIKLEDKIEHYTWTHIAATFDKKNGIMKLYMDGAEKGSLMVPKSDVSLYGSDIMIGVNDIKMKATDLVREDNNIPQVFGIEGLIDEVKIYNSALTSSEVSDSYKNTIPGEQIVKNPDLQRRILPGKRIEDPKFGASYHKLQYHDLWDDLRRTCDNPDISVTFDNMPTSIVFWQATSYAPTWVTENNIWMGDQSAEVGGPWGCAEHMSDKEQRHSYVRIVENTPARVVIHWRYSCADIAYIFDRPDNWSDEYITIYPDGTSIRKVSFHGNEVPTWHEPQLFSQAGTGPLDNIDVKAMTVANLGGEVYTLDFSNGPPENTLTTSSIELFNLKSEYKIFNIIPDGTQFITTGWFNTEQSPHTPDPFAGPWNHFPVSKLLSDGRLVTVYDRMTSCALGEGDGVTRENVGLYGFTDGSISSLIPLAKSWNYPSKATSVEGSSVPDYNKEERAYELTADAEKISFTLNASESNPIVNPVFVIHNWGRSDALVKIDGKTNPTDIRQGHVVTSDRDKLVIFVKKTAAKALKFEISRSTRLAE
jgi:hypothetical protein